MCLYAEVLTPYFGKVGEVQMLMPRSVMIVVLTYVVKCLPMDLMRLGYYGCMPRLYILMERYAYPDWHTIHVLGTCVCYSLVTEQGFTRKVSGTLQYCVL